MSKPLTQEQTKDTARQAYYVRAQSWAEDRERGIALSRRFAWLIAAIAITIAMLEAVALAFLSPLKETIPYTLLVDRHTGYVQVLKGADQSAIAPDAALTQSLLAQYVTAREGFDITGISSDYRKVALWSAETARKEYIGLMPTSNPASPFRRLPRTSVLKVSVKSISQLAKDVALVRFDTMQLNQGQESGPVASWAAIVRYRFVTAPMSFEDRLINPLGFQVVRYQKDPETLPNIGNSGTQTDIVPVSGTPRASALTSGGVQ